MATLIYLVAACFPCITATQKLKTRIGRGKDKATIPRPLPIHRRSLSEARRGIPLDAMGLFGRLPVEMRQMAYAHVLEDRALHLIWIATQKRIRHFDCGYSSSPNDYHPKQDRLEYYSPPNSRLRFLKVCRHIYIESSNNFYTSNTFSIYGTLNFATFVYISQTIILLHLTSITSIFINSSASDFEPRRGQRPQ